MRCVVFGGGGFIGSTVVDRLLLDGHFVRVVAHPRAVPYRIFGKHENAEWVAGDFLDLGDVQRALDDVEVVFHLVSTTLPKSADENPLYDVRTNLVGTLQLLDAMAAAGVKRIIFISSGGTVYGAPVYIPIDEHHPTNPQGFYGLTKLSIERYLASYERAYGIRHTVLRVANAFGERQRLEIAQGAVGVFLYRAMQGQPIEIWGDGTTRRDYIHAEDIAAAFSRVLTYKGSVSTFNVSTGIGTSLNELLELIEEILGQRVQRTYLPRRPFDVGVSVLSNVLIRDELNWAPKVPLRDGIERMADWISRGNVDLEG